VTVRHDLNQLKLCMYEAISHSLDGCPLSPEKISHALAAVIDEYVGREGEARIERFVRELLRCMEQHTEGITATMKIARDVAVAVDVDPEEARIQDEEVTRLYMDLYAEAIPSGLVDYEGGDPTPKALEIALAFAVAMCLKHDATGIERFIQDLHAEHRRADVYQAKYAPAWSRLPWGNA
jgi:hypothetical protein